jgi:hypothetical protein
MTPRERDKPKSRTRGSGKVRRHCPNLEAGRGCSGGNALDRERPWLERQGFRRQATNDCQGRRGQPHTLSKHRSSVVILQNHRCMCGRAFNPVRPSGGTILPQWAKFGERAPDWSMDRSIHSVGQSALSLVSDFSQELTPRFRLGFAFNSFG